MGVVVGALPGELRAGRSVARAVADVEIRLDGTKDQLAAILADKGDVRRFEEIEVFPLIHLGDAPPPREDAKAGARLVMPSLRSASAPARDCRRRQRS